MNTKEIFELFEGMFQQARIQTGGLVNQRWFHDGDGCPGCGKEIKEMKFKGKNALSLNAFIYREHGVLIAYLLCGKCARYIHRESAKIPHGGNTPLHTEIEKSLKQAFVKHLGH
jgi:hypothetical protein